MLTLEIPLRAEVAQLMHAMADGIRYPIIIGRVPAGDGVIWSAKQLMTSDWPANFCTYLFLGDAARGLCWFAENDRGWSRDPTTANLELRREGEQLIIRVQLANQPFTLDTARTMTFGVQAAPIKPRLEGWRHRWYTDHYSILGWIATGSPWESAVRSTPFIRT